AQRIPRTPERLMTTVGLFETGRRGGRGGGGGRHPRTPRTGGAPDPSVRFGGRSPCTVRVCAIGNPPGRAVESRSIPSGTGSRPGVFTKGARSAWECHVRLRFHEAAKPLEEVRGPDFLREPRVRPE